MALGQTITVVNKSGKVVSTSKHLVNVFKEAKSAYRERKAELKATRNADLEQKRAHRALENLRINDGSSSRASSPRSRHSEEKKSQRERLPIDRGYSDSFYTNDRPPRQADTVRPPSRLRFEQESDERQTNELVRRHTDTMMKRECEPRKMARSASMSDIDMDLAYGELPPPLPVRRYDDETELRVQMSKMQLLLEELNCVQYSVTAIIENLQKNPDALAAVALTLAEISNLASKMAPGVLTALKGSFPAIIALLASPQFMIAAGVGVGVTIIAFGGYKIIKKIKERRENESESTAEYDELQEVGGDFSHIEMWRRGISDTEAASLGTSVDGEFMTPAVGRQLLEEGRLTEDDLKSMKTSKTKKSKKVKVKSEKSKKEGKEGKAKKEPSGLRMLFKSH
ncbi:hypothetical protein LTR50_003041 [Elasticomyces elasticus]|nr:hypothetical protein LTR50_003041 [Elasticomyces elasticus]